MNHLPIQNLLNMLDKTSSEMSTPLISPRASTASLRSIVQKSDGSSSHMDDLSLDRASRVRRSCSHCLCDMDSISKFNTKDSVRVFMKTEGNENKYADIIHIWTWFTVQRRPPAGIESKPLTSSIAFSNSTIPCPVTAHVQTCFLKIPVSTSNNSSVMDGAQSILLMTRMIGVAKLVDICRSQGQTCKNPNRGQLLAAKPWK